MLKRSVPSLLLATLLLLAPRSMSRAEQGLGVTLAPYNFLETRRTHPTRLIWQAPSPQDYKNEPAPAGVQRVVYRSDKLELAAWLALPERAAKPTPGVVYVHGGFAFAMSELQDARPFLEAGFAVLTPTFRGENGNPGDFELFFGEVDDLAAAVRFLADVPGVDPKRVYAFGHSSGGGLAALLALLPDVPLRASGSSGGLYVPQSFANWGAIRFPVTDPLEWELRAMLPHIDELVHPHLAFLGDRDWSPSAARQVNGQAQNLGALLRVITVKGDHWTALRPSVQDFIDYIRRDGR